MDCIYRTKRLSSKKNADVIKKRAHGFFEELLVDDIHRITLIGENPKNSLMNLHDKMF